VPYFKSVFTASGFPKVGISTPPGPALSGLAGLGGSAGGLAAWSFYLAGMLFWNVDI